MLFTQGADFNIDLNVDLDMERINMNGGNKVNLVKFATDALQAQERISWCLGQQTRSDPLNEPKSFHECLDLLRSQKAKLEGSDADFVSPCVDEASLLELKQLTLMFTPSSVTPEARDKFRRLVEKALHDQCKRVLSLTLLTCPWYEASQHERGEQAKHNILFIVFCSKDDQFFSPANPHVRENASVIDFGWFTAVELTHFCQAICRGRSRHVEIIFPRSGADLYNCDEWEDLKKNLNYTIITGTPGFLEACLGQAVGGISKKRKNGGMKLIEGASVFQICASLRLLQLVENTLCAGKSCTEIREDGLSETGVKALAEVKTLYDCGDMPAAKQKIFQIIMSWVDKLRPLANSFKGKYGKANQSQAEKIVGEWMMKTRLQGREMSPLRFIPDEISKLQDLLRKVGGPVANMRPEQILLVAVAGSAMYNLNTPSSDIDYVVVYATPTEQLLSATKKLAECHESRGKDKAIEYGAYEARLLCEMLLKSSVVILELLFTDHHEYTSPMWKELTKHKQAFVTEKAISQYLGLVKNNFRSIDRGRHSNEPKRDRKLFYQNFHKLRGLRSLMRGELPQVRLEPGPDRDFIMSVRTQEDAGAWSRENLLSKLQQEYTAVREALCARSHRLRENPDFNLCSEWLMKVRGIV